ncbi:MAG: HEAT repeat domain-containing protein [Candidatus Omnitrophica bacterium]|nr:HEAT repeat domain-containing protein [Candidatus Omnitrophota bacterium]
MQTKSSSAGQNSLARFLGATVRSVEKEFNYILSPKKRVPAPPAEKLPQAKKENFLETISAALMPLPSVIKPAPVVTKKVSEALSPRQEPLPPAPEKSAPAPVVERRIVSQSAGLAGIAFANKTEEVEAEIYFRDLQSSSKATRLQALREVKKLSQPTATALLDRLLSIEQDTLQIIEILNALAGLSPEAAGVKNTFKDFSFHKDAGIRMAALRAVSKYHDEESFNILASAMKDKNAEVRRQVLNCLCWTFGEQSIPFTVNGLHDSDAGVRKAASQIAGALKAEQAISGLISLLSDPQQDVQVAASASLKKITGEDFGFKASASKQSKQDAVEGWRFWWRENQMKFNRTKV